MSTWKLIVCMVPFLMATTLRSQSPDWSVDATQYEHSMLITAVVIDGDLNEFRDESSQIAAFVNGEVRGVASMSYEASLDRYFAYLLVYSNSSGETISFEAYDAVNDLQFDLIETITFEIDAAIGDLNNPQELLSTNLSGEAELLGFSINDVIDETSFSEQEVTVQLKQEVDLTSLVANFSASDGATVFVNDVVQVTGETVQDFTSSVSYEVRSANRLSTETYTINVSIGPYPQISGISELTIDEGDSFDVLDLDDFEAVYSASEVVWEVSNRGELEVTLDENNQLSINIPDENWFGTDSLSLIVTHAEYADLQDSTVIILEVNNINDAPVFDSTPVTSVFQDSLYTYSIATSDIDSESLTIELLTGPEWLNVDFDGTSGQIFGVPRDVGNYDIGLTVSDGSSITQQNFSVLVSDRMIDLKAGVYEIIEGAAFDTIFLSTLVSETDYSDFIYAVSGNDQMSFELSGDTLLVAVPDMDYAGSEVWSLEVTTPEDELAFGKTTLSLVVTNINDAPVITSEPLETGVVDALYQYTLMANDVDGDAISLTAEQIPEWLSVTEIENSWILSGVPTEADTYLVSVLVSDGTQSTLQTFDIVIEASSTSSDPEPIRLVTISDQVISEGQSFSALDLSDFLINRDSAAVIWSVIRTSDELVVTLSGASLQVNPPDEDWNGLEALTLVATDTSSAFVKTEQVVLFKVNGLNDAPIIESNPMLEILNGSYYEYKILVSDVDGDKLDFSSSTFPDWIRLITTDEGAILFGDHVDDGEEQFSIAVVVTDGSVIIRQEFEVQVIDLPLSTANGIDPAIRVFPNPASNWLHINTSGEYTGLKIINLSGQVIGQWQLNNPVNRMSVDQFDRGIYMLLVEGKSRRSLYKIVLR